MAETILSLAGENSWTINLSRTTKKHIHWVTAVLGTVLAATGTGMIIYSRKKHFNSLHGKLGNASINNENNCFWDRKVNVCYLILMCLFVYECRRGIYCACTISNQ